MQMDINILLTCSKPIKTEADQEIDGNNRIVTKSVFENRKSRLSLTTTNKFLLSKMKSGVTLNNEEKYCENMQVIDQKEALKFDKIDIGSMLKKKVLIHHEQIRLKSGGLESQIVDEEGIEVQMDLNDFKYFQIKLKGQQGPLQISFVSIGHKISIIQYYSYSNLFPNVYNSDFVNKSKYFKLESNKNSFPFPRLNFAIHAQTTSNFLIKVSFAKIQAKLKLPKSNKFITLQSDTIHLDQTKSIRLFRAPSLQNQVPFKNLREKSLHRTILFEKNLEKMTQTQMRKKEIDLNKDNSRKDKLFKKEIQVVVNTAKLKNKIYMLQMFTFQQKWFSSLSLLLTLVQIKDEFHVILIRKEKKIESSKIKFHLIMLQNSLKAI